MVWWAWIILGIACIAIEIHFTHDFSLFCVGVSALIVGAITALSARLPDFSQWLVFGALSVAVLLLVRKPLLGREGSRHRTENVSAEWAEGASLARAGSQAKNQPQK